MPADHNPEPGAAPRILIVEDDPGVRRSLLLLLQGRDYDVKAHSTADAALAHARTYDPDCLVVDYQLGGDDGIALIKALRMAGCAAPAILISAFGSADLTERARAAGFAHIFDKPLRAHPFLAAVSGLVGEKRRLLQDRR
ncbi:response regulator [Sphingopyxis sp.]|uniref:response regulator n=1 Tax=Sphingopyxis sp. TaxID=1908224 RepID=UPI003BA8BCCC